MQAATSALIRQLWSGGGWLGHEHDITSVIMTMCQDSPWSIGHTARCLIYRPAVLFTYMQPKLPQLQCGKTPQQPGSIGCNCNHLCTGDTQGPRPSPQAMWLDNCHHWLEHTTPAESKSSSPGNNLRTPPSPQLHAVQTVSSSKQQRLQLLTYTV